MTNSLSKINDPWLRIVTGASASFAIVTIVSAVIIGLTTPKNKSASANKILATLLDISQYYFCHLFKESTGIASYKYIIQKRVEKAKNLIKKSQLPLS